MIGNYVESIYNIVCRNKKVIEKYKLCLRSGRYRSNCAGNVVYNVERKHASMGTYDEIRRGGIAKVIYPLTICFQYKVAEKEDETFFEGDQILISSSGKEIKVFNYSKKRILTKYEDSEKFDKIVSARKFFSKFFLEVPYVSYNMEEKMVEEEFLEISPYELDMAIDAVFMTYTNYIYLVEKKRENKEHIYARFEKDFGINISPLIKETIPSILTHGDLWSSNILFSNNNYYVIDYEHVKMRHFYFDFFCLIFHEMFINGNGTYMKKYFSGQYDEIIKELFSSCGVEFVDMFRKDYFLDFIAEIYYERWKNDSTIKCMVESLIDSLGIYS